MYVNMCVISSFIYVHRGLSQDIIKTKCMIKNQPKYKKGKGLLLRRAFVFIEMF